ELLRKRRIDLSVVMPEQVRLTRIGWQVAHQLISAERLQIYDAGFLCAAASLANQRHLLALMIDVLALAVDYLVLTRAGRDCDTHGARDDRRAARHHKLDVILPGQDNRETLGFDAPHSDQCWIIVLGQWRS